MLYLMCIVVCCRRCFQHNGNSLKQLHLMWIKEVGTVRKRMLAIVVVGCLFLSACGGIGADLSNSLNPPKPSGEFYHIQSALEDSVGGEFRLVYPLSGDYRAAINAVDADGDGVLEAFAFYSTDTGDKSTAMHINHIKKNGEKWESVADIQVTASGVESVELCRLDNSGSKKLIVNWSKFSSLENQLSVYSVDSGILTEVTSEPFSTYLTCDFDSDGISEIVSVYMDTAAKTATATLTTLNDKGFAHKSTCAADPFVLSYSTPKMTRLTDGTAALFIDAQKKGGTITEMFGIKDGELSELIKSSVIGENLRTFRASDAKAQDFNGDGCLDIPLTTKLPKITGDENSDNVYMTTWNSFDGKALTPLKSALINYTDGYHMVIPDSWVGNFGVWRNPASTERIIFHWDSAVNRVGEEIMRIELIKLSDWSADLERYSSEYSEITRNAEYVFAARLSNSALTPDITTLRESFTLIDDFVSTKKVGAK